MNRRLLALILPVLACLMTLPAWAGGKAGEKASVTFHIEADRNDNPKLIFPEAVGGRERIFRRLPDITLKDIQAGALNLTVQAYGENLLNEKRAISAVDFGSLGFATRTWGPTRQVGLTVTAAY